jgi:tRNA pseudouridine32 synthase/23S rRNA pseudouridine746 synthase
MTPEELVGRLLHRDGLMLVINKPAGIPVHRGPKGGENLEAYFDALRFGLARSPALAHRLDRDTSGCLVLGRHRKALQRLMQLFKQGRVEKRYWAVVEGAPVAEQGEINLALGRLDADRGWWMKVDPLGLASQTRWRVLGRGASPHGTPLAFVELEPLTGRTHQLRVHCAATGWPILGDAVYGSGKAAGAPPLHLHARRIVVPIDKHKPPTEVEAPVPEHMKAALQACGWSEVPARSMGTKQTEDAFS